MVWTATTKSSEEHGRFKGSCESLHLRSEADVQDGTENAFLVPGGYGHFERNPQVSHDP